MAQDPREEGFVMTNDDLLAFVSQVYGAFQSIPNLSLLNALTQSDAYVEQRFQDGQIFYVSSSSEFYKVNKTPIGSDWELAETYETGDSLASAAHTWFGESDISFEKVIFPTASYIDPQFISASAHAEGFGSGGTPIANDDVKRITTAVGDGTLNAESKLIFSESKSQLGIGSLHTSNISASINFFDIGGSTLSTASIKYIPEAANPRFTLDKKLRTNKGLSSSGSFEIDSPELIVSGGTQTIITTRTNTTSPSLIISGSSRRIDAEPSPQVIFTNAGQTNPTAGYVNEFHTFAQSSSIGIYEGSGFITVPYASSGGSIIQDFPTSYYKTVVMEYNVIDKTFSTGFTENGVFYTTFDQNTATITSNQEIKLLIGKGISSSPLVINTLLLSGDMVINGFNNVLGVDMELIYKFKAFRHSS
jgi:hypothetical protein